MKTTSNDFATFDLKRTQSVSNGPSVTLFEPLFLKRSEPLVADFIITCNFNVHSWQLNSTFSSIFFCQIQVSLMNKTRSAIGTLTL